MGDTPSSEELCWGDEQPRHPANSLLLSRVSRTRSARVPVGVMLLLFVSYKTISWLRGPSSLLSKIGCHNSQSGSACPYLPSRVVPQVPGGSDRSGFCWKLEHVHFLWPGAERRCTRGSRCSSACVRAGGSGRGLWLLKGTIADWKGWAGLKATGHCKCRVRYLLLFLLL